MVPVAVSRPPQGPLDMIARYVYTVLNSCSALYCDSFVPAGGGGRDVPSSPGKKKRCTKQDFVIVKAVDIEP